jgi:hypothetical protein
MKAKLAFIAGVGLGYLVGTEAGRENLEKAKDWARTSWEDPKVQSTVRDVEERVTKVLKEQGAQLTDKVTAAVKEATSRATGRVEDSTPPAGSA